MTTSITSQNLDTNKVCFRFDNRQKPIDGGKAQFYKMLRRETKHGDDMIEVGSSTVSEMTLVDQPRGIELEYAVAVNRAETGEPSNTITITL